MAEGEVDKFLLVGFILEIDYTDWLANMILVKKLNDIGESPSLTRLVPKIIFL